MHACMHKGIVLYELCTLRHPFDANNQGALIIKIIRGKYPPLPNTYSPQLSQVTETLNPKPQYLLPAALSGTLLIHTH
jgi:NIMA (never in mitosis gene a)-related kinase